MKIALYLALGLLLLFVGARFYFGSIVNPRVERELREDPNGERALKVMLIGLPSGTEIPVNYYREDDKVWAGADGRWWKELEGDGAPVTLLLRGEDLRGSARAILDDPAYTEEVFAKLRPNALKGFGTLVEIQLDPVSSP